MTEHAPLPPSGADRWGNCPASAVLEPRYPVDESTPEQMEGNAAHEVAATLLRQLKEYGEHGASFFPGEIASNGIVLTDEIIDAAELFVDTIVEEVGSDALDKLHIEERIDIFKIHPDNWGTSDVWWEVINPGVGAYIHVWDFKFGHRFVEAYQKLQLVDYGWGVVSRPEYEGVTTDNIEFNFGIVQPRNFHPVGPVRRWKATGEEVFQLALKLQKSAHSARGNDPTAHVGPWCQDCQARRGCPALQQAAYGAMDIAGSSSNIDLSPSDLGIELRFIHRAKALLDARATGLEEQATALIKGGKQVPGYELERTNAREQWTVTPSEVYALGSILGVDLRQDRAITPRQAIKAGLSEDLVKGFSVTPPGSLKLKKETTTLARKVFGNG